MTRRQRRLWPMALIAAGSVGSLTLPSFGNSDSFRTSGGAAPDPSAFLPPELTTTDVGRTFSEALGSLDQLRPALVAVSVVWLVVLLCIWVLTIRSEAALSWATLQLARDLDLSHRQAWRESRRFFWRFAGVWLIGSLASLLVAAAPIAWAATHRSDGSVLAWFEAYVDAVSSPALFLGSLLLIPLHLWLGYAKRAIALGGLGFGRGLAGGWRTLRRHFGLSLLGWVINVAFATAGLIVLFLAIAVLLGVAAIVFAVILRTLPNGVDSLAGGLAPYVGAGLLVGGVLMLLGLAALSLFLWTFWSQLYLRLSAPVFDSHSVAVG